MLRLFAYLYFLIALIEVVLVPVGKLDLTIGLIAGATSFFFGAVLLGLGIIVEEIRAIRAGHGDIAS